MKTKVEIQKNVWNDLTWEADSNTEGIDIICKQGHVTLSGTTYSYTKKVSVETERMRGVRGDSDIEKALLNAIRWNSSVDINTINVRVKNGWVTIDGEVGWEYQRSRIRHLAEDLRGVAGVTILIRVVPGATLH